MTTNKRKNEPDREREAELINELHRKGHTHTDIARCLERERKIFKVEPAELSECLKEVERIILNTYRRVKDGKAD